MHDVGLCCKPTIKFAVNCMKVANLVVTVNKLLESL